MTEPTRTDQSSEPVSPTDLTWKSWRFVARRTIHEYVTDQAMDLAAALTYWAVLAVAPALLALVSLLGLFGDREQIVDRVLATVADLAPGTSLESVQPVVDAVVSRQGAGIGLVIGLLVALWSASGYVNAFARAMNRIYEVDEGRPFWKLRPLMVALTLVLLVLGAVVAAAMVLSGGLARAAGELIGLSSLAVAVWNIGKWPVVLVLVAVIIALLYYATPNVRQPRFRWITMGSVLAIVVWGLASVGFGFYVSQWGNYRATYGALAGVILFLLWVWLTNNALLFGAELDAELQRARQLQAGIPAESELQLPARDTAGLKKRRAREAKDMALGTALRLSGGRSLRLTDDDGGASEEGDPAEEDDRAEEGDPAEEGRQEGE